MQEKKTNTVAISKLGPNSNYGNIVVYNFKNDILYWEFHHIPTQEVTYAGILNIQSSVENNKYFKLQTF